MAKRVEPKSVEQEFTFRNVQLFKNETLGTGSYGAVCKAKCDQLICAAKLLYPVLFQMQAPDPGKEHRQPFRRFELECQFLSRVNHPNIVQYLGTYRDPDTNAPVLLMELMDESLTHFLESSPGDIPYHIQVNLSQDIAQALAFLHANGIIHRDLSSNNVLLIAGSRAKVSDFGMSKFADINKTRLATMTTCPGTPAFMSPEALDEPPVYTEKLDTFSFGVLLVQINTRQFPEPADRFKKIEVPNPQNPSLKLKVLAHVPEVERRQAHIRLIEPTHPLLPIALECLKDEAVERPSSQQLCMSLDALKRTVKYEKNQQQDMFQQLQEQVREKDQQLQAKSRDLQVLQQEKDQQLQAKSRDLQVLQQEKDRQIHAKDQLLRSLQHEVEANEHQLRRLHQQLESNEQTTATLQHTITQRDREVAELRELVSSKDRKETSQSPFKRGHLPAQAAPNLEQQLHLSWKSHHMDRISQCKSVSAVVGEKVYFQSGNLYEFSSTSQQWKLLPVHPLRCISFVSIENELVTVGGYSSEENWLGQRNDSNKLYTYSQGKWVERYTPMPTKRWNCSSVYTNSVLIVAGGVSGERTHLNTVEMLNIRSKRWSKVNSLPTLVGFSSASICGEHIFLHDIYARPNSKYSVVRSSLLSLALSTPKPVIWEDVASLPVQHSTLVTVNGHLLAVGGESTNGERSNEVRQYNPTANSWQVISQMKVARSECAAVLLPNKLMVAGGVPQENKEPIEMATIL